ncbi:hypothetical protein [Spirulina sp. CS-785/01]|uniref:hypothetical protein n=1 Tax=Spirulina sp. CS-785/01 TaxID=3021716 RepID=UPI0023311BFC|nr:hypothetical protein [Spirulina sp. CS-785/01]
MNIKLLEGEKIEFNSSPNYQNNHQSKVSNSHEINEKYIQGKRRIVTEQARYPLESIISMIESGKYKLDPDFQRRRRWDDVRKSKLIENKSIITKNIEKFYKEQNELFSGRKTSPKDVKERIDKMLSFLGQYVSQNILTVGVVFHLTKE